MKIVNKNYFRDKYIEEIVKFFDWNRVNKTMIVLDWKWAFSKNENGIPSIEELKESAIKQLKNNYDACELTKKTVKTGSGGFYVEAYYNNESNKVDFLKLSFVLTTWDSWCDPSKVEENLKENIEDWDNY